MAGGSVLRAFRATRDTERRFAEHVAAFDAAATEARNGACLPAPAPGTVPVPRDLLEQVISVLDDDTVNRQLAIQLAALTESEAP